MADPLVVPSPVLRQLRVEHVMGTVVSIDVRPPFVKTSALDEASAWFHDVDRRFSIYRDTSEISRLAAGTLRFEDASPDVRAKPRSTAAASAEPPPSPARLGILLSSQTSTSIGPST